MDLKALTERVKRVSDIYSERFGIDRSDDWYLAKLTEELGELVSAELKRAGRGRTNGKSNHELTADRNNEAADLLAHLLLYADHNGIDLEATLKAKWFKYLGDNPNSDS